MSHAPASNINNRFLDVSITCLCVSEDLPLRFAVGHFSHTSYFISGIPSLKPEKRIPKRIETKRHFREQVESRRVSEFSARS